MVDFNLPTDVYAYSGLPKEHREGLLSSIMPTLKNITANYPSYIESKTRQIGDVTKQAGTSLLNQLATKNLLGSSLAVDATKDLMKTLNEERFNKLADLSVQYPAMLSDIASLGYASEQPFQPYQSMLNFLASQS